VRGYSRQTVRDRLREPEATGIFFYEQTAEAVTDAILRLEAIEEDFFPEAIREHALQFDTSIFIDRMRRFLSETLSTSYEGSWSSLGTEEESLATVPR
jgi:hypothetical protein